MSNKATKNMSLMNSVFDVLVSVTGLTALDVDEERDNFIDEFMHNGAKSYDFNTTTAGWMRLSCRKDGFTVSGKDESYPTKLAQITNEYLKKLYVTNFKTV